MTDSCQRCTSNQLLAWTDSLSQTGKTFHHPYFQDPVRKTWGTARISDSVVRVSTQPGEEKTDMSHKPYRKIKM